MITAYALRSRGRFAWAVREYEHIIDVSPHNLFRLNAMITLAEMHRDQLENLAAAESLERAVKEVGADKPAATPMLPPPGEVRSLGEIRAEMNFFFACHWQAKGDAAKARGLLEKALADNPSDVDVLIACYRLPDQTPQFHKKIQELIRSAADAVREKIEDEPAEASNYNEFAWLVGNTEGDMDEALKFSKQSLELAPGVGGYYDTLAHVYAFGKKDYENAVKTQSKAAELDPRSRIIGEKLDFFRKKLEESKAKK